VSSSRDRGALFAESIASEDEALAAAGLEELRSAPPSVLDEVARRLEATLAAGGPEAARACAQLARGGARRFGGEAWQRLMRALTEAQAAGVPGAQTAFQSVVMHGPDPEHVRKLREERASRPVGPVRQLLSVASRIWVWVALPMACVLLGVAGAAVEPTGYSLLPLAIGVPVTLVSFVALDAFLRRCPRCRLWLGGRLLALVKTGTSTESVHVQAASGGTETVQRSVSTFRRDWRCVRCGHAWST